MLYPVPMKDEEALSGGYRGKDNTICLSDCFIARKRQCDKGKYYKRKHVIGALLTMLEVYSLIVIAGNMAACRQTLELELSTTF